MSVAKPLFLGKFLGSNVEKRPKQFYRHRIIVFLISLDKGFSHLGSCLNNQHGGFVEAVTYSEPIIITYIKCLVCQMRACN